MFSESQQNHYANKQIKLKKVNLGEDYCNDSDKNIRNNKQRCNYSEISNKRRRYCYKQKNKTKAHTKGDLQISTNQEIDNSLNFYDGKYFHNNLGVKALNQHQNIVSENQDSLKKQYKIEEYDISNISNLFERSKVAPNLAREKSKNEIKKSKEKLVNQMRTSQKCDHKKRSISSNFIDFRIDNKLAFNYLQRSRPHSSLDSPRRPKSQVIQQKSLNEKMKTLDINPYTNKEYLHVKERQKQKIKLVVEQLKKKEVMCNILKPCQIFQKKINRREQFGDKIKNDQFQSLNVDRDIYYMISKNKDKKNKDRALTAKPKKKVDLNALQPWNFKPKYQFQEQEQYML